MVDELNADFSMPAFAHTEDMEWEESPSAGVWRKRLDLVGGAETGRVTSIVRYDADSSFSAHDHPGGEEILVLEGVFSDEHGDYPKGSYMLNPEGFHHAPFSREGCVLFVKLRQFAGNDRRHVIIPTEDVAWAAGAQPGTWTKDLYSQGDYPEHIYLSRLDANVIVPHHDHPKGREALVLEGEAEDEFGRYKKGSWVRLPPGSSHSLSSKTGVTLYVKSNGLGDMASADNTDDLF